MPDPTFKQGILNTCEAHGLDLGFQAYFLTMVELAGGDLLLHAADPERFMKTMERNLAELGYEGAMCMPSTTQNDPRTG